MMGERIKKFMTALPYWQECINLTILELETLSTTLEERCGSELWLTPVKLYYDNDVVAI